MGTQMKIDCPAAERIGIALLMGGILLSTIAYACGLPMVLSCVLMITFVIAGIALLCLKGTCAAGDKGAEIKMPIGSDKTIPYSEIGTITLGVKPGRGSRRSSLRPVIFTMTLYTNSGDTTLTAAAGENRYKKEFQDPEIRRTLIGNSVFNELAACISQRSGAQIRIGE